MTQLQLSASAYEHQTQQNLAYTFLIVVSGQSGRKGQDNTPEITLDPRSEF